MRAKGIIAGFAAIAIFGGSVHCFASEDTSSVLQTTRAAQDQSLIPPARDWPKRYQNWNEMAREYVTAHPENKGLAKLLDALSSVDVTAVSAKMDELETSTLNRVVFEGWKAATPQFEAAVRAQSKVLETGFAAAQLAPFMMPSEVDLTSPFPDYMPVQALLKLMAATARMSEACGNADDAAQRAVLLMRLSESYCSEGGARISYMIGSAGISMSAKTLASVLRSQALSPKVAAWVLKSLQKLDSKHPGYGTAVRTEARSRIRYMRRTKNDPSFRKTLKPLELVCSDAIQSLPRFEQETDRIYRLLALNYDKPIWQRERRYSDKLKAQTADPVVALGLSSSHDEMATRGETSLGYLRTCETMAALRTGDQNAPMRIRDPFADAPVKVTPARVYSVGPDMVDQGGTISYDPTNGTISAGDLVFDR